jgi:hypothetical protein
MYKCEWSLLSSVLTTFNSPAGKRPKRPVDEGGARVGFGTFGNRRISICINVNREFYSQACLPSIQQQANYPRDPRANVERDPSCAVTVDNFGADFGV